jgi:hypothetical protein
VVVAGVVGGAVVVGGSVVGGGVVGGAVVGGTVVGGGAVVVATVVGAVGSVTDDDGPVAVGTNVVSLGFTTGGLLLWPANRNPISTPTTARASTPPTIAQIRRLSEGLSGSAPYRGS